MSINTREHTFPLIEVSGTSYEMGYQHGVQAGQLVQNSLKWKEKMSGKPRESLCNYAKAFLPMLKNLSAALVDEIRGLAKGADINFEEALLCQTGHELVKAYGGSCTAFALTGSATADGNTLAGQNEDMRPELTDVAILLHVKPNDGRPRAFMLTSAGRLGSRGMNEYGVVHLINGLHSLDHEFRRAMFRSPLNRIMLEKQTVEECVNLLEQNRTCSAVNKIICDGQGGITDVEVRPDEGIAIFSDDHPHWRIHTNHYLTPQFIPYGPNWLPDSKPRLERMRSLIKEHWGKVTVDTMKTILADHDGDPAGICRHGEENMYSIVGYIAEPAKGLFHARKGHGCTGTWQAYKV